MTTAPIRLTVVQTHPVQYLAPWFRHIAASCRELDLTVLYGAIPSPAQQGAGFDRAFAWDVPLTEGYRFKVCAGAAARSFDSDRFFGLDVPDIEGDLRETRPDVVLVPGWHSIMQVRALAACRRLGVPVLYRGDSTLDSGPRRIVRPAWRLKTHVMLRRFDGYLSVGAKADEYLRTFGIADPLIVRSPHCVDNARFGAEARRLRGDGSRLRERAAIGARASDFVVLFAGKFQARKRPLDAVRAVAQLGPSAVLMMAGDGPLAEASRQEAARLGVRLAWRGFLNQSAMPRAFAAADCAVVPSAWESWGLIVNEALASGVPCVVTTGVASAADLVVEGSTGHAFAPGDVETLTSKLAAVRDALRGGHDFAPACRSQADTCGFAAATGGLLTAIRRVTRRHPSAGALKAPARVVACCGGMVSVFGVERITFELLRAARERGAAVHTIVNSWESSRIVALAEEVGASWSPGHYRAPFVRRRLTPGAVVRLAWDVIRTSAVLWRDARRLDATHVLVPDFVTVLRNLPAIAALRASGVRLVMNVGNAPDASPFYRRLWTLVIGPMVDLFIANSHFTAAALSSVGVPSAKTRVVYNTAPRRSTAAAEARVPRDSRRVIYVGQLIPPKGLDLLLDAVGMLAARGMDVRLDAVGAVDGWESPAWQGYHARLRARAAQPDLSGRVRFLGQREDVPALLAAAAVHCAPSRPEIREAFGLVVAEAKEAGIPSVVTPVGALPELVNHRRDGWVCADATAASLAAGLEYFLAHPSRAEEAGRAARLSAGRFSSQAFADGWADVLGIARAAAEADEGGAADRTLESHAH